MLHYGGAPKGTKTAAFGLFAAAFFVSRLIMFPVLVYCNGISAMLDQLGKGSLGPGLTCLVLASALQGLQVYWFARIIRCARAGAKRRVRLTWRLAHTQHVAVSCATASPTSPSPRALMSTSRSKPPRARVRAMRAAPRWHKQSGCGGVTTPSTAPRWACRRAPWRRAASSSDSSVTVTGLVFTNKGLSQEGDASSDACKEPGSRSHRTRHSQDTPTGGLPQEATPHRSPRPNSD